MTKDDILRLREKEKMANQDGIRQIIMELRVMLVKLKVLTMPDSIIDAYTYMNKHSPLFKKKV